MDASSLDASSGTFFLPRVVVFFLGSALDASAFDASALDASALDASALDASTFDASTFDASTFDASTFDASTFDASTFDASTGTFFLPRAAVFFWGSAFASSFDALSETFFLPRAAVFFWGSAFASEFDASVSASSGTFFFPRDVGFLGISTTGWGGPSMIPMFGSNFVETALPDVFEVYPSNQTITWFTWRTGMSSHSFINIRFMSVNTCFSNSSANAWVM